MTRKTQARNLVNPQSSFKLSLRISCRLGFERDTPLDFPPPFQTGTLMVSGMTVFCGTIYYHALTEEKSLRKFTPYGGMLLIAAWLGMVV